MRGETAIAGQQQRLRSALGESHAVSDGRDDEYGIEDGSEGDNVNAIREVMRQVPSDLEREARFAHARRAGEGEQADVGAQEQSVNSLHLVLTANQRRE